MRKQRIFFRSDVPAKLALLTYRLERASAAMDAMSTALDRANRALATVVADRVKTADPGNPACCVGCGCTDGRACAGGCWWLEVDRARHIGLCSSCGDKRDAWQAASDGG